MEPIREAATGLWARLEADGYSASAAEFLAVRFMAQCMRGMNLTVPVDIGARSDEDPKAESAWR